MLPAFNQARNCHGKPPLVRLPPELDYLGPHFVIFNFDFLLLRNCAVYGGRRKRKRRYTLQPLMRSVEFWVKERIGFDSQRPNPPSAGYFGQNFWRTELHPLETPLRCAWRLILSCVNLIKKKFKFSVGKPMTRTGTSTLKATQNVLFTNVGSTPGAQIVGGSHFFFSCFL
jgi:hypothetical protein